MSLCSILNNTAVKLLCCVSEPLMGIFISIMKQLKIYKKLPASQRVDGQRVFKINLVSEGMLFPLMQACLFHSWGGRKSFLELLF